MHTTFNYIAYLIYLPVVILVTWRVAYTLFKNSKVFMMDIFHGKSDIALSTNKLFETGFYLLNLGFAFWIMQIATIGSQQELLEKLSAKIGGFFIYLGVMVFFNLYLFFRGRRVSNNKGRLAPVPDPLFPKA
ncbi:hypothetical protein CLV59_10839 [Chitinophaga dinghuensis]|uniref:Integral membrane protein n=1 Tax=Chitinophaga dinghuensis TaxID=1539050 RepID=A0A327VR44_9BACT|nr:hypothetical protein [Chitinophaga dinghuensis]RAJ76520.1 hypothetical protein CLV59_10839 [Chitinophaga dinghuensis]